MHSVETRKFFIPCVVLIEENGRLYGSEKKAFQGVDLLYERKRSLKLDAESNSVRPDTLVSLSLQGFAHPRIVYVRQRNAVFFVSPGLLSNTRPFFSIFILKIAAF